MPSAPRLLAALALLLAADAARADEEAPCKPASPADARLVDVAAAPKATLSAKEGGVVRVHATNRTGRVLCRVLAVVSLDGRERPATCVRDDGVKPAGEADLRCTFPLLSGEAARGGVADGANRRPGQPAKTSPPKVRVKVSGLDLAEVDAFRAWEARRVVAAQQAAERAAAAREAFRQTVTLTRGPAKDAREVLDRALGRLKECVIGRAKRNPKLVVVAKLRVGVSRPRSGEADGLLAVKVLSQQGLAEVRDCLGALDLIEVPGGLDFEAIAEVSYQAAR
jgi:hypothetical protein